MKAWRAHRENRAPKNNKNNTPNQKMRDLKAPPCPDREPKKKEAGLPLPPCNKRENSKKYTKSEKVDGRGSPRMQDASGGNCSSSTCSCYRRQREQKNKATVSDNMILGVKRKKKVHI